VGLSCGEDSERKWWRMLLCIKLDICASVGAALSIASQQMWIKTTATGLKGQRRGEGQRKASRVIAAICRGNIRASRRITALQEHNLTPR
jgi:hypothetical protein